MKGQLGGMSEVWKGASRIVQVFHRWLCACTVAFNMTVCWPGTGTGSGNAGSKFESRKEGQKRHLCEHHLAAAKRAAPADIAGQLVRACIACHGDKHAHHSTYLSLLETPFAWCLSQICTALHEQHSWVRGMSRDAVAMVAKRTQSREACAVAEPQACFQVCVEALEHVVHLHATLRHWLLHAGQARALNTRALLQCHAMSAGDDAHGAEHVASCNLRKATRHWHGRAAAMALAGAKGEIARLGEQSLRARATRVSLCQSMRH